MAPYILDPPQCSPLRLTSIPTAPPLPLRTAAAVYCWAVKASRERSTAISGCSSGAVGGAEAAEPPGDVSKAGAGAGARAGAVQNTCPNCGRG